MASINTRDVERDSMFLMTDIVTEGGGAAVRVKIRNLSASGMMMEGDVVAKRDTRVTAELRNIGLVAGTIVWVMGRRSGVAFDEPIDPKLARTTVYGGDKEAPFYARGALAAPRHDGWNGKLRRV